MANWVLWASIVVGLLVWATLGLPLGFRAFCVGASIHFVLRVVEGLRYEEIETRGGFFSKERNPRTYYFAVAMYSAVAVLYVVIGFTLDLAR